MRGLQLGGRLSWGTLPHSLAMAVQLDHNHSSKWLIENFHELSRAESYKELHYYKYCYLQSSHETNCRADEELGNKDVVTNVGESEGEIEGR